MFKCEFEKHKPLFIHDSLWTNKCVSKDKNKNGYYVYSKIDLKLYINNIFDILEMINNHFNNSCGIIVFKNSNLFVFDMLKQYEYCSLYGYNSISLLTNKEKFNITYIDIDGESG